LKKFLEESSDESAKSMNSESESIEESSWMRKMNEQPVDSPLVVERKPIDVEIVEDPEVPSAPEAPKANKKKNLR